MDIYYVYAYLRKSDGTPYYIGKGKGRRAFDNTRGIHSGSTRTPSSKNRIRFIERNLSESEAHNLEKTLIQKYGRKDFGVGILRNRTDGGEGTSGYKHTKEAIKKISKSSTGSNNPMYGKNHKKETRNKISQRLTGLKKGKTYEEIYGLEKAEELRKTRSKSLSDRIRTPEMRLKYSQTRTGKKNTKVYTAIELTCPHCGKSGKGPNMARYHFKSCKFSPL